MNSIINISKLPLVAIDWAVASINRRNIVRDPMGFKDPSLEQSGFWIWEDGKGRKGGSTYLLIGADYSPTKNPSQGNQIADENFISRNVHYDENQAPYWVASMISTKTDELIESKGETSLEAAMRCFVKSELGEEIEAPDIYKA